METGRQQRHWFDYVMLGIRTFWLFGGIRDVLVHADRLGIDGRYGSIALVLIWYGLAYAVTAVTLLQKRIPRQAAAVAELAVSGGLFLYLAADFKTGLSFYTVPVFTVGYLSSGLMSMWSFVASVIAIPLGAVVFWKQSALPEFDPIVNLVILFILGFCFQKMVTSFWRMKRMVRRIEQQNQTLEVYAKQIEQLTLSQERGRLARELHDTVGHTFTSAIMGMDAVYYLMDMAPNEAKNKLGELLQMTRKGLAEARSHIHQIAANREPASLTANLSQIAGSFAKHTDTKVRLETVGAERLVSERIHLALVRCLQESLTNAKRHGLAGAVDVLVTFSEQELCLRIEDDGQGTDQLDYGFGLRAMTERLAAVNGTLTVSSTKGKGTIIIASVPLPSHS